MITQPTDDGIKLLVSTDEIVAYLRSAAYIDQRQYKISNGAPGTEYTVASFVNYLANPITGILRAPMTGFVEGNTDFDIDIMMTCAIDSSPHHFTFHASRRPRTSNTIRLLGSGLVVKTWSNDFNEADYAGIVEMTFDYQTEAQGNMYIYKMDWVRSMTLSSSSPTNWTNTRIELAPDTIIRANVEYEITRGVKT